VEELDLSCVARYSIEVESPGARLALQHIHGDAHALSPEIVSSCAFVDVPPALGIWRHSGSSNETQLAVHQGPLMIARARERIRAGAGAVNLDFEEFPITIIRVQEARRRHVGTRTERSGHCCRLYNIKVIP